jgi:hypothetical protein
MLLPIVAIGIAMGLAFQYFETRSAPKVVRDAFATACLFSAFNYQANVEKALGGFILGFVALSIALNALSSAIPWLAQPAADRRRS